MARDMGLAERHSDGTHVILESTKKEKDTEKGHIIMPMLEIKFTKKVNKSQATQLTEKENNGFRSSVLLSSTFDIQLLRWKK